MTGTAQVAPPPVPRTFLEYVRSFGPGIVIVLTWLGAGDVIDMATAGANYGYSLLWVFVVAVLIRFLFVSLISRYQLCNQHREGVLDGLVRLHPAYAPILFVAAVVMGHVSGSYMTRGVGEVSRNMFGLPGSGRWRGTGWRSIWSSVRVSGRLLPPLIWTLPGTPGFVALTLAANSAQVILVPMLAGGLWWITASERLIGREHRNRWWENVIMAILFGLAPYFAIQPVRDLVSWI